MFERWIDRGGTGEVGPDGGVILADEELPNVGRITIEEKERSGEYSKYYAVTEGMYGWLVHPAYFHDLDEAQAHMEATKLLIQVAYPESRG